MTEDNAAGITTLDDGLVLKLLNHETFKLKLERQVQAQTQIELDAWWKKILAIVGLITAILAAFGIKEYVSFNRMVEDAKAQIAQDRNAFRQKTEEVAALIRQAGLELSSMQGTAASIQAQQTSSNTRLDQLLTTATNASVTFSEQFGKFSSDFNNSKEKLNKDAMEVQAKMNQAEITLGKTEGVLSKVEQEQASRQSEFNQAKKSLNDKLTELTDQQNSKLTGFQSQVDAVTKKVYDAGSFIPKEKIDNPVQTVANSANQALVIHIFRISPDLIKGLGIKDSLGNPIALKDAQGNLLPNPTDFTVGRSLTFTLNEYDYTLTLRYVLELALGADRAGVDVTWSKRQK